MKINIREELNKRDLTSNNKFDLLSQYDAHGFDNEQKKKIAEALAQNCSNKFLSEFMGGNTHYAHRGDLKTESVDDGAYANVSADYTDKSGNSISIDGNNSTIVFSSITVEDVPYGSLHDYDYYEEPYYDTTDVELTDYEYEVPTEDIITYIYENLADEDIGTLGDATEYEIEKFIIDNISDCLNKIGDSLIESYEEDAIERAYDEAYEQANTYDGPEDYDEKMNKYSKNNKNTKKSLSESFTDREAQSSMYGASHPELFPDYDDDYDFGYSEMEVVEKKQVYDSDGFLTDYTWYRDSDGNNIFIFGDSDRYTPDNTEPDWEVEAGEGSEEAAKEWFDSYNGFDDEDEEDGSFELEDDTIDESAEHPEVYILVNKPPRDRTERDYFHPYLEDESGKLCEFNNIKDAIDACKEHGCYAVTQNFGELEDVYYNSQYRSSGIDKLAKHLGKKLNIKRESVSKKPEKKYFVEWKDSKGASHNGNFYASNIKEIKYQLPDDVTVTKITVITDESVLKEDKPTYVDHNGKQSRLYKLSKTDKKTGDKKTRYFVKDKEYEPLTVSDVDLNADLPNRANFIAYKQFKTLYNPKDPSTDKYKGKLFPLFVGAKQRDGIEIGKWYKCGTGELRIEVDETGKPIPGGAIQVDSKLGNLAYRPGWHMGSAPVTRHIGVGASRAKDDHNDYGAMYSGNVWAKVEYSAHYDYTDKAKTMPGADKDAKKAMFTDKKDIENGYYHYKTNSNADDSEDWLIADAIKVLSVLSDATVRSIASEHGLEAQDRWEADGSDGNKFYADFSQFSIVENMSKGIKESSGVVKAPHKKK